MNTPNKSQSRVSVPTLPSVPTRIWIRLAFAAFLILFPFGYGIRVAIEINRAPPYLEAADARQERADEDDSAYGDVSTMFDGDPIDGQLLYWPMTLFGGAVLSLMIIGGVYLLLPLANPWPWIGIASGALAMALVWLPPILGHSVIDGVSSYI